MVDMNALLALQGQLFLLMALGAFFQPPGDSGRRLPKGTDGSGHRPGAALQHHHLF